MFNESEGLSGQGGMSESMFPHMTASADRPPTPEEVEKAMAAVQYNKVVTVKKVEVCTYNLSKPDEVKSYVKTRKRIMGGMQTNTIALVFADRKFVEAIPGYIAHMEWIEYDLKVDPIAPASGALKGDTDNGQAST
jgi:hypothetical protein